MFSEKEKKKVHLMWKITPFQFGLNYFSGFNPEKWFSILKIWLNHNGLQLQSEILIF